MTQSPPPSNLYDLTFVLNGAQIRMKVEARALAFEILRRDLGATSVRDACGGVGMCGACTILVAGRASPSCLLLALDLADQDVMTLEGLSGEGSLHSLQRAFVEQGALQCGFCTAGMILAAKALLDECPNPSQEEIKRGLTGNLCRCTGYAKIIQAVASVAAGSRK
jgi:carbon-monoxide dehydrogenase small subunit